MKSNILLIIYFISILSVISCQKSNEGNNTVKKNIDQTVDTVKFNIYNEDFFGFTMSNSKEEIIQQLKKQEKSIKIYEYEDIIMIAPENQDIFSGSNLDYEIVFYKNKILRIRKYVQDKYYKDTLYTKFGFDNAIISSSNDNYLWTFGEYVIT